MLAGICFSDISSEASGLFYVWVGGLEPEEVGIRGEFDGSFGCSWQSGAVVVEAFSGPGDVPREEDFGFAVATGQDPSTRQGHAAISVDFGNVLINATAVDAFRLEMLDGSWDAHVSVLIRDISV